jgi:hypothetical protein
MIREKLRLKLKLSTFSVVMGFMLLQLACKETALMHIGKETEW